MPILPDLGGLAPLPVHIGVLQISYTTASLDLPTSCSTPLDSGFNAITLDKSPRHE
jgi:hypothetical protein